MVRRTDKQILAVCHAFREPADTLRVDLGVDATVCESFGDASVRIENGQLVVDTMRPLTAHAVLLDIK